MQTFESKQVTEANHTIESKPHVFKPQPHPAPRPFMSFSVGRAVNTGAKAEYGEFIDYQDFLGVNNDAYEYDEDGYGQPRYDYDDQKVSLVAPDQLHVRHLYAADVGEIIVRNFCDDSRRIIKPREVKRRIFKFTGRYRKDAMQFNSRLQSRLQSDLGFGGSGSGRTLGDYEATDETMAMMNGIFHLQETIEAFGRGNVFGFAFSDTARRFLASERLRALDMAVSMLGVDYLDSDIEDRITTREHHVSIIRLGLKMPNWEVSEPLDPKGNPRKMPKTFVTEFDPKAKPILENAN